MLNNPTGAGFFLSPCLLISYFPSVKPYTDPQASHEIKAIEIFHAILYEKPSI
jgi:hypothetical protein